MTIDFSDRVAVITGAGGGLGRAYALELARRGARVVVNDFGGSGGGVGQSQTAADKVVAEISAAGGNAVANYDSVATRAGGTHVIETAMDAFGRVDILISNAGILRNARFEELTDEQIDAVLDVHLKGAFYVGQPAFKIMKQQKYGRILFTSSASGMFGHPWQANYGAAKAGLVGLSNVVALEGRDHGVLSNALLPGAATRLADEIDFSFLKESSEVAEMMGRITASNSSTNDASRLNPEWVMPLALYLVSEACTATHREFSAVSGRYAEVFVGATDGWASAEQPTPEVIAEHFAQIADSARYTRPLSVYHEVVDVRATLQQQFAKD